MPVIQTDYQALFNFSDALEKFAEEIEYQMKKLASETDSITAYSWRGKQADDFSSVIHESKDEMDKQIQFLRDLSEAIDEKAADLRAAQEKDISRRR